MKHEIQKWSMTHDYQLNILKTILVIIPFIAIFQRWIWDPKHLRWSSLGYYIITRREFTLLKSATETLEHEVNYVQS